MGHKETKFFFIDEQGTLNNDQEWLLRGGYLIGVADYMLLSREIKALNEDWLSTKKEIKWSDISSAIYLKKQRKKLNADLAHLDSFTIQELENYLDSFFDKLSRINITIIMNISQRSELVRYIKKQESFVKIQLQNLMQRCQFEGQEKGFITILVHENENTHKDDRIKKDEYKKIINTDSFVKDYSQIVDNLFIEFSNLNTGIQVADFIVGVLSASLRGYETSTCLYKKYLEKKVRKDKNGEMIGYGLLLIPNSKTSPEFSEKITNLIK